MTLLIILHVIVSFFLIGIVLLQHGKGADIGATFGGSNQTLFGTEGPMSFLHKITTGAAIIFMATSFCLAYISARQSSGSVMSRVVAEEQKKPAEQVPAAKNAPQQAPAPSAEAATPHEKQAEGVKAPQQEAGSEAGEAEQKARSAEKLMPGPEPATRENAVSNGRESSAKTTPLPAGRNAKGGAAQ